MASTLFSDYFLFQKVNGVEIYITVTGIRGIANSFFNNGATWGWVVNATPRPLYPRERDPVSIL
jgi:hypothetical protein